MVAFLSSYRFLRRKNLESNSREKKRGEGMSTSIAVVCSSDFAERLKQIEAELPSIKLDYYLYKIPQESAGIVPKIKPCDAVFFSGPLSYMFAKEVIKQLPIPWNYLQQDETAIATTLLSITKKREIPIQQISIDLIDPQIANSVLEDIGFLFLPKIHQIKETMDIEEIVRFHHTLYSTQQTYQAVTSMQAVFEILQELNVPVIRMIDPRSSIIKGLIDTKNKALLAKSQSAKIAVGYIKFDNDQPDVTAFSTFFKTELIESDEGLFMMYLTQGDVLGKLEYLSEEEWKGFSPIPFKLAFGFGDTITNASYNAKDALQFAKYNTAYIINDQKELLGPYPKNNRQIQLQTKDPELVELAKVSSLSPANLSKVIQFSRTHNSTEFTSQDLEAFLQVSRRSTERILKKLVDHGFARIVGEEMTYQQGRPRAIYELNFPTYLL